MGGWKAAALRAKTVKARATPPTLIALGAFVIACAFLAISRGAFPIGIADMVHAFQKLFSGGSVSEASDRVVLSIRGPRVLAGLIAGAALAGAGVVYQGLFRNPLVSPDVLGVSTGAGLGAVAAIFLSLPVAAIQLFAFLGGLCAVGLVYIIASAVRGRDPTLVLVLAGVVVGALAGAAISLLKILADPYDQLPAITFWLLGSLSSARGTELWSVLPTVAIGLVPLILLRWRINLLSLGDEEAKSLGVEAGRLRALVIAAATLMTASVVAISGVIGWVGLIIPHIARMIVGPNFERLLPAAMLLGAGYLVLVDTAARTLARIEIPLGILTAMVGAPFFLWLLWRGRREWS